MASRGQDREHDDDGLYAAINNNFDGHGQADELHDMLNTVQSSATRKRQRTPPSRHVKEREAALVDIINVKCVDSDIGGLFAVCDVIHKDGSKETVVLPEDLFIYYDNDNKGDDYEQKQKQRKAAKKRKELLESKNTGNKGQSARGPDGTPTALLASAGAGVVTPVRHQSDEEETDDAPSTDDYVVIDTASIIQNVPTNGSPGEQAPTSTAGDEHVHNDAPNAFAATGSVQGVLPAIFTDAVAYDSGRISDNNGTDISLGLDTEDTASNDSSGIGSESAHIAPATTRRALKAIPLELERLYSEVDGLLRGAGGESRAQQLRGWRETFQVTSGRLQVFLRDRTVHDRMFNWRPTSADTLKEFIQQVKTMLVLFQMGEAEPPDSLRQYY